MSEGWGQKVSYRYTEKPTTYHMKNSQEHTGIVLKGTGTAAQSNCSVTKCEHKNYSEVAKVPRQPEGYFVHWIQRQKGLHL